MTKVQTAAKGIIAHLHAADKELRKAMVLAGDSGLMPVTHPIREAQFSLDDALTRAEVFGKKKNAEIFEKHLTFAADGL